MFRFAPWLSICNEHTNVMKFCIHENNVIFRGVTSSHTKAPSSVSFAGLQKNPLTVYSTESLMRRKKPARSGCSGRNDRRFAGMQNIKWGFANVKKQYGPTRKLLWVAKSAVAGNQVGIEWEHCSWMGRGGPR
jgi:hypothetical protein